MYLTETHIIKSSKELDILTFKCKNLYNKANYIIRQEFINNGKYINKFDMFTILKDDEDYVNIGSTRVARNVIRTLDANWRSFFETIKDWKKNKSKYKGKFGLPLYLDKKGKFNLTSNGDILYKNQKIGYIKDDKLFNTKNNAIAIQQDKHLHDDYRTIDLYKLLTDKIDLKNLYDRELAVFKAEEESHKKKIKELEARIKETEYKKSKIVENVNQAKSILKDIGVDLNDHNFIKIKELLKDNLGYCGLFTKFFFIEKISLQRLEQAYLKIKELGNKIESLPKNIIEYTSFESLDDDLNRVEDTIFQNKIFNLLPRKQKDLFNDKKEINNHYVRYRIGNMYNIVKNRNKGPFMNSILGFKDKPELIKQFTKKISAYDSSEHIVDFVNSLLDGSEKTYDKILALCKSLDKVYIRYADEEKQIIIVRVDEYKSLKKLASDTNWCIAREKSYFDRYSSKGQQFILFDFKRPSYHPLSIIGITVDKEGDITDSHDKRDGSIRYEITRDESFYKMLGLNKKDLYNHINYKPDTTGEKIGSTLNKNKYIKKFLDLY